ncbi:hypothetical protein FPANT_9791 [Fusarium pseudoanthophilum]|uniref:Uncharacterized protein n=1 Tax=Fusarium pseudoanthophilum TaxID=48495 RepID=A0A8H5KUN6_9HYPO|nr:hypothetical protein FPANT_9791 [Fusarium pseudoanthophilum]
MELGRGVAVAQGGNDASGFSLLKVPREGNRAPKAISRVKLFPSKIMTPFPCVIACVIVLRFYRLVEVSICLVFSISSARSSSTSIKRAHSSKRIVCSLPEPSPERQKHKHVSSPSLLPPHLLICPSRRKTAHLPPPTSNVHLCTVPTSAQSKHSSSFEGGSRSERYVAPPIANATTDSCQDTKLPSASRKKASPGVGRLRV